MTFAEICLLIIILLLVMILIALVTSGAAGVGGKEGFKETLRSLRKSNVGSTIAGVCAGFGKYTAFPAWIWRVIFLGLLFCGGAGILAYLILALCMPTAQD